jgi:hypothetical protein
MPKIKLSQPFLGANEFRHLSLGLSAVNLMKRAGLTPDPWQEQVLRSHSNRIAIVAARQSGKSTTTGCLAVFQAIFTPDSLVLLIAPTLRQSSELFAKVLSIYSAVGRPVATAKDPTTTTLTLVNGSRIITLPGDPETLRGFSAVSLAVIDEAARVVDAMFPAITPMLAISRGRLVLLSTPWGRRGTFFDVWQDAASGGLTPETSQWERIAAKSAACPRLDRSFLDEQRRLLGERMYLQEYECEFIMSEDQVFTQESVDAAFQSDIEAISGW